MGGIRHVLRRVKDTEKCGVLNNGDNRNTRDGMTSKSMERCYWELLEVNQGWRRETSNRGEVLVV